jgi:hypothetical protein
VAVQSDLTRAGLIAAKLADMQIVFTSGPKADSLILASQWMFDSHTGHDELLNYIQAMVVLEILLGDKAVSDEIGLGQLLSNRCAYSIGDSHEDRKLILQYFKDIYRIRSEIVHRGKHRLTAEEGALFSRLRWMCRRVIQNEVHLLKADLTRG